MNAFRRKADQWSLLWRQFGVDHFVESVGPLGRAEGEFTEYRVRPNRVLKIHPTSSPHPGRLVRTPEKV
ncbi:hypothetical protein Ae707Ps1_4444c [Pseudonocardia sp. Ae707_Ps1]|nr:hypothetical protein Ae707Ps1_4444c [Pseudonocardia sp. Ae707_Ps1]